jgi:hypothetical protein
MFQQKYKVRYTIVINPWNEDGTRVCRTKVSVLVINRKNYEVSASKYLEKIEDSLWEVSHSIFHLLEERIEQKLASHHSS